MAQKKKYKKKDNAKVKKVLKDVFGSLFKNQTAIDSSKEYRWWVGILFLVLSVVLPVIPLTISSAKTKGSDFIGSYNYKADVTLTAATVDLKDDGYSFQVNENSELLAYKDGAQLADEDYTNTDADGNETVANKIYEYKNSVTGLIELQVFYDSRTYSSKSSKSTYVNSFLSYLGSDNQYKVSDNKAKTDDDDSSETYYVPSAFVLYKNGLYFINMKPGTTTAYAHSYVGSNWKHTEKGVNILDIVLDVDSTITADVQNAAYCSAVLDNWLVQFNKAYTDQKSANVLYSTLIYAGIYAALILFMGLMIFLLTRGKKNMFSYLKFGQCMQIEFWSALCPALIAMIAGFFLSSYAQMIFIVCIGMRTMWLSMKQLRPQA